MEKHGASFPHAVHGHHMSSDALRALNDSNLPKIRWTAWNKLVPDRAVSLDDLMLRNVAA